MIAIVDYGSCNVMSMKNMLAKAGAVDCHISRDADVIAQADRIILPGVGSFDSGIASLKESNLIGPLRNSFAKGVPILGICLGMQLLGISSEEGSEKGLGFIDFECVKFRPNRNFKDLRVPHMGWDYVHVTSAESPIASAGSLGDSSMPNRFYFAHSYYAVCHDKSNEVMTCTYGSTTFAAAVQSQNAFGVQFHPEKSHIFGLGLLKNFLERTKV